MTAQGKLYYVVGAAGLGKEGLLAYAREHLTETHPVMFAHRYVARGTGAGDDHCVVLSDAEFALRKRHGLFALTWESGGAWFGIGSEINYWLAMGLSVVANGSRGHLAGALAAYPDLVVIWVTGEASGDAPASCRLEPRLAAVAALGDRRVVHIRNGEPPAFAGERLLSLLVGSSA